MTKRGWTWTVVGVVVVAGAVAAAVKLRGGEPDGLEVEVEAVERMEIVQTVTATGRVQPRTQVDISADVSGKITRLGCQEGDWIEEGTLLVELDRDRYLAALESAEASLRVSRAGADVTLENMGKAQKDLARSRELHAKGLETEARLDAALSLFEAEKARHAAALDQVEQARANVKQVRHDLSLTRIHAPMDGTVSKLNKEVGEIVLGSQFQEDVILVLSNLAGMEAEVDVDENDVVLLALQDPATIEVDALPGVELPGRVTEIASSATITGDGTSDQKTEFKVKIAIEGRDARLRPGMTATAEIVTEVKSGAVGVPIQAVAVRTPEELEGEGGSATPRWETDKDGFAEVVFVVAGDTVEARSVETGIQSESHVEVVTGLSEGERVVIGNYRAVSKELKHGSRIAISDGGEAVD